MTTPTIKIHNLSTGEVIEREMNAEELTQYELDRQTELVRKEETEAKATARQTVLDRLGITVEEVQLILGGSN